MTNQSKRAITFVLTKEEIKLLMEVDSHFFEEFSRKELDGNYEFSYSYDALLFLKFVISFARDKRFDPLLKKVKRLLKLSDSFSRAAAHTSPCFR